MPSRRAFLGLLAGAALDPERLLWRPGAKVFSFPPRPLVPVRFAGFDIAVGASFTIAGVYRINPPGIFELQTFRVTDLQTLEDSDVLTLAREL